MVKISDPDLMTREECIFATIEQKLSIRPCGALTDATATGTDGVTVNTSKQFTSATGLFTTTNDVNPGDILCIFTGEEAGHYVIDTVDSATQLTLLSDANFTPGDTGQYYEIREPTGGAIDDGATIQALYSFTKEEWLSDSENYAYDGVNDDLIRYQFPWVGITPEQFEIGGSSIYGGWDFFENSVNADYTRKKVRDGGWDQKNVSGTLIATWSGMRSLGSLLSTSQSYFQQIDTITAPTNFEFTGSINESIKVWWSANDRTTYLKLFLRTKGQYYDQYDLLTAQELSAIGNKKYAFPLSESEDPAISTHDAEFEGLAPFQDSDVVTNDTDGITTVSTGTFTNTGATDFAAAGVEVGDVLYLSTGSDAGYYTITNVATTTITVEINNSDFTTFAGDTGITFQVLTKHVLVSGTKIKTRTDGAIIDVDTATGTITSTTGGFTGNVAVGDIVIIEEAADDARGAYIVTAVTSDTVLTVDTTDHEFPGSSQADVDFSVVNDGMYFQYKWETITLGSTGDLAFGDDDPDTITRASGSWITDGVTAGDIIVVTGAEDSGNNKSFTVAVVTSATVLTLISTDVVVANAADSTASLACYAGIKRTINGELAAFKWKLLGNGGTLAECYEFHQKMMRESVDIDVGPGTFRGDVNDLLITFIDPNGSSLNCYVDDLNASSLNNITYIDAAGNTRLEAYVAAGTITFDANLQGDTAAEFWVFFLNDDPPGDNNGADFNTVDAIVIKDAANVDLSGLISGSATKDFTYDYDNNSQRGTGAKATDAPFVAVAIGKITATYARADGTLGRSKTNAINFASSLERNYAT